MGNRYPLLLMGILLILAACSRPAPVAQAPAKAAADATLSLAQKLEQKQFVADSEPSYQSARRQYRRFADLRGEEYAVAGLARLAFMAGAQAEYQKYRTQLAELITQADPPGAHVLLMLDLYVLQNEGDYAAIKALAVDSYDYPLQVRVQVLTHALQAESWLKPGFSAAAYEDLARLSNRYRRSLNKDFSADPSVLAAALYAMAYHTFLLRDYAEALAYSAEAEDLDTRYENFIALGYDLWLRGTVYAAMNEASDARRSFIRAASIFTDFGNTEMLLKTQAALARLQGD